jgi:hypothetical protein
MYPFDFSDGLGTAARVAPCPALAARHDPRLLLKTSKRMAGVVLDKQKGRSQETVRADYAVIVSWSEIISCFAAWQQLTRTRVRLYVCAQNEPRVRFHRRQRQCG